MEIKNTVLELLSEGILNITFSNRFRKSYEYNKVNITKIEDFYQVSKFQTNKSFMKT